jgi:hypothetical protein
MWCRKRIWASPKRMTGFGARYCYLTAHACMCERAHSQGGKGDPKKDHGVLREPKAVRFKFIEEHRFAFSIGRVCDVMDVSPRGLRAFRNRPASRRQRSDLVTLAHIKEQSRLSLGSYGRPRMTEELKEIGLNIGHRCVGRFLLDDASIICQAADAPERHISDQNPQSQVQHCAKIAGS